MSRNSIRKWYRGNRGWLWGDVVAPWALTRFCLLLVGWFAQALPPDPGYPLADVSARGWQVAQFRLLDIWARWDSGWYLDLAQNGYRMTGDPSTTQTNIAFFPLYPGLIWLATAWLPVGLRTPAVLAAAGVVISNVLLLVGLALIYRLVEELTGRRDAAAWTVIFMLVLPASLFFSAVYTEATFLCLSAAAFYAGVRRRWFWAGVFGALLALTRPPGVFSFVGLLWLYLDSVRWRWRFVRPTAGWLLLIPLAFVFYLLWMSASTDVWFAPLQSQAAWEKDLAAPWTTLLQPVQPVGAWARYEQGMAVLFLVLAVAALFVVPTPAFGVYALLLGASFLFTGTLQSAARYTAVAFPAWMALALLTARHVRLRTAVAAIFFTLLVLEMALWSQFYPTL